MCRDSAHCGDCEDCRTTDEWIRSSDLRPTTPPLGRDDPTPPPLARDGGETSWHR